MKTASIHLRNGLGAFVASALFAALSAQAQGFRDMGRPTYRPSLDRQPLLSASVGSFTARPHLELSYGYDDNVFLAESGEVDDTLFGIAPGLMLSIGNPEHNQAWLDYTFELIDYTDLDSEDNEGHTLELGARSKPGRWILDAKNSYAEYRGAELEVGDRVELKENRTALSAERRNRSKTAVAGLYDLTLVNYETEDYIDSLEQRLAGRLYWQALPRTELFGEYAYGWVDLKPGEADFADATYHEISAGARRPLTSRITGSGRVGYQTRSFDGDVETVDHWTARASFSGELPSNTRANVGLYCELRPSIRTAGLTAIDTGASAAVARPLLGDRVSGTLSGRVGQLDWQDAEGSNDRTDDYWSVTAALDVQVIRSITVGADVTHSENSSDEDGYSFERNQATLRAGANF